MRDYAVLMVDVVKSRKYAAAEREGLQHALDDAMEILNYVFGPYLLKRVTFSAGDEMQGLFECPSAAFLYYRLLRMTMGSFALRAGLGVGTWDTRMEKGESPAQDGEAYHFARSALRQSAKDRIYNFSVLGRSPWAEEMTIAADHSLGIAESRTRAQRDISLVVELSAPIVCEKCRVESVFELMDLARVRCSLDGMEFRENESLLESFCGLDLISTGLRMRPAFTADYDYNSSGLSGLSYELASLLPMTRQGLEKGIAKARVVQERNAAVLFASTIDRMAEGSW